MLLYDQNIIGASLQNIQKYSVIFGKCPKNVRNIHLPFGTILENLRKSSSLVRLYNKKNITDRLWI